MRGDEGLKPGGAKSGVSHAGRWGTKAGRRRKAALVMRGDGGLRIMKWKVVFHRCSRQELEQKKDRRNNRRSNNFTNVSFYLWAPKLAYVSIKAKFSPAISRLTNGLSSITVNSFSTVSSTRFIPL